MYSNGATDGDEVRVNNCNPYVRVEAWTSRSREPSRCDSNDRDIRVAVFEGNLNELASTDQEMSKSKL